MYLYLKAFTHQLQPIITSVCALVIYCLMQYNQGPPGPLDTYLLWNSQGSRDARANAAQITQATFCALQFYGDPGQVKRQSLLNAGITRFHCRHMAFSEHKRQIQFFCDLHANHQHLTNAHPKIKSRRFTAPFKICRHFDVRAGLLRYISDSQKM